MPSKSRRKKKYAGQRRPQIASTGASVTSAPRAAPASVETLARPKPAAAKTSTTIAPSPSGANVGRELKTIGMLGGGAIFGIVVLSLVLR